MDNGIQKLLSVSRQDRFEYIEKLKDKEEFLHSLVKYLHYNLPARLESGNSDYLKFLQDLLQAEAWAKQNVNIRGILEYLMFKILRLD